MLRKEAVVLASRALALLSIVSAVSEVCYLPEFVDSLVHYSHPQSVLSTTRGYWYYYYLIRLSSLMVRIVGFSLLARWLFKGGLKVEEFLLPSPPEQNAAQN